VFQSTKNGGHLGNDVIERRGLDRFFLFCPKCLVEASRIPKVPFVDLGRDSSINCISNPV